LTLEYILHYLIYVTKHYLNYKGLTMKKEKKEKKNRILDFSILNEKESNDLHGAGWEYCPLHLDDDAICCQAISTPDSPYGSWWCPH
jgi:hypothetical protein